jgi:16S rRNA (guanine(966)-N(2))-methyltransferase RsmD
MRIIAGKYKGRKLLAPKDDSVRPTTDRVKENIFNILQFDISGASVLDLFAGSGALGIEAISRGADEVWFVDRSRESIELIKKNLEKVQFEGGVLHKDFKDAISDFHKPFDVIFVDAPYSTGLAEQAIKLIMDKQLLAVNGVIVYEHPIELGYMPSEGYVVSDVRHYGNTAISFIRRDDQVKRTYHGDEEL